MNHLNNKKWLVYFGIILLNISSFIEVKAQTMIAIDSFAIQAALYSNVNSIPDNDPSGFSQYYVTCTVPINKSEGIAYNDSGSKNFIWFRNLYITPIFNGSTLNYVPIDSFAGDKHVNRLDLYQYAYFKLPFNLNIFTYIFHKDSTDKIHCYLDLLGGLMYTKDTSNSSGSSRIIPSGLYGLSLSAKTKPSINKSFTLSGGLSIFSIHPFSNSVNSDLNYQYRNLSDTSLASNSSKSLTGNIDWYWKAEFGIVYGLNSSTATYLHFNYINNLSSSNYMNSYFQIQLGVNVDIISFFSKSSSNNTSSSNKNTKASGIQTPGLN